MTEPEFDWTGFERLDFRPKHLKLPLLVVVGKGGVLACAYLDRSIFDVERARQPAVIVSGVDSFDAMLRAEVKSTAHISDEAYRRGIRPGQKGFQVLENFRRERPPED